MIICELRVRGQLDQHWSTWLDGLLILHEGGGTTLLRGPLPDEAALYGVLMKIRDLGLPLISLRRVESDGGETNT
jgi:hypothetical protein